MTPACREALMESWNGLLRVRRRVLDAVEADLKGQGLPPLNESLALILLRDHPQGMMRPTDMESALELPQYTMSRILDRLEKSGAILRKACPVDGRSNHAALTEAGRRLIEQIWPVYCAAIEKHLGTHLCDVGAQAFSGMLKRITPEPAG